MNGQRDKRQGTFISLREMIVFAMLGTLMFTSKLLMELLPNVHLLGAFTMSYTVAFRKKALIPIYVYVFVNGVYAGFATWWIPYLYVWTVLWGITMLIPKRMPKAVKCVIYPAVCALHGFGFGILYAPGQALVYGLSLEATITWIIHGFPWDITHGIGNLFAGILVFPISELLKKLIKKPMRA